MQVFPIEPIDTSKFKGGTEKPLLERIKEFFKKKESPEEKAEKVREQMREILQEIAREEITFTAGETAAFEAIRRAFENSKHRTFTLGKQ